MNTRWRAVDVTENLIEILMKWNWYFFKSVQTLVNGNLVDKIIFKKYIAIDASKKY